MWLPKPIYDVLPFGLGVAGLIAIASLPMAGKIGGVVLIGVALLIFRLRRQAAAARLARDRKQRSW